MQPVFHKKKDHIKKKAFSRCTNGFLVIFFVVFLVRLPMWLLPLDNDSGGFAYHARLMLQGEPLYKIHHPAHYLPGVYYTYAGLLWILGDQENAIKMGIIIFVSITAYLLFKMLRCFGDNQAAWLAAFLYVLLSQHDWLKGVTGEAEVFANLPITYTSFLLICVFIAEQKKGIVFTIGVLSGISVLYKPQFISPLVISFATIFIMILNRVEEGTWWQWIGARYLWLLLGFSLPLVGVCFFYYKEGLSEEFLRVFSYGQDYLGAFSDSLLSLRSFFVPLAMLSVINFPVTLLGLVNILQLLGRLRGGTREHQNIRVVRLVLLIWFLISVLQAGVTQFGYPHYTLTVAPSLSVLAALELSRLIQRIQSFLIKSPWKALAMLALAGCVLLGSLPTTGRLYYHFLRFTLGLCTKEDFIAKGVVNGNELLKVIQLSEYLKKQSATEDLVYYWSDNVQLYYLAERRNPLPNEWPIYAGKLGDQDDLFVPQTRYIIIGESEQAEIPAWLIVGLNQYYAFKAQIVDEEVYQRKFP